MGADPPHPAQHPVDLRPCHVKHAHPNSARHLRFHTHQCGRGGRLAQVYLEQNEPAWLAATSWCAEIEPARAPSTSMALQVQRAHRAWRRRLPVENDGPADNCRLLGVRLSSMRFQQTTSPRYGHENDIPLHTSPETGVTTPGAVRARKSTTKLFERAGIRRSVAWTNRVRGNVRVALPQRTQQSPLQLTTTVATATQSPSHAGQSTPLSPRSGVSC